MKYIGLLIAIAVIGGVIVWAKKAPETPAVSETDSIPTPMTQPAEPKEKKEAPTIITTTKKTHNGMTIETIKEGNGPAITNGQTAVVQYEGKLQDGSIFDSTAKHGGRAFEFPLGAGMVIKGWDQGVLGMKVGETRLLTIPPELGYGANGYPPIIPQNATLIFTVTLEGIK